jgi:GDP-L-fucose synthase
MNKDSKIYVAGHLGLVGSAIWKSFVQKGYSNLVGRTIDELNLLDQKAVEQFFATEKPEYVVLAAAKVGGIVANNTYRGEFIYENLQIQNNVIHQSYVHGVKKLLFLGSTCIYPREAPQPMPEYALLTGELEYTNEPYAIAKITGLKMCESYNLQYGTNFIAVMPTNLYGPNDNFDLEKSHVLPALIRKIHLGKCLEEGNLEAIRTDLTKRPIEGITGQSEEKIILAILEKYGINEIQCTTSGHQWAKSNKSWAVEIWGTGAPMREFLWSEDMADASTFMMEHTNFRDIVKIGQENGNKAEIRNTHINIGTGQEISIKGLAYLIKEKTGYQGNLVFNAQKPDGTMRKLTDPSKLHSLGWKHKVCIEEGIERLYHWYQHS